MRRPPLVAATLALALSLSACGGVEEPAPEQGAPIAPVETNQAGDDERDAVASGATFDFTYQTQGPSNPLTVRMSDDLRAALGPKADQLVISEVILTPYALDGVEHCATEMTFTWNDPDFPLHAAGSTEAQERLDERSQDSMDEFLEAFGVTTPEEFVTMFDALEPGTPGADAFAEAWITLDHSNPIAANAVRSLPQGQEPTGQDIIDAVEAEIASDGAGAQVEIDATTPETRVSRAALYHNTAQPLAELDASNPEQGLYLAPDYQSAVNVMRCAASAMDTQRTSTFVFRDTEGDDVAEVDFVVMADDTVSIASSEVDGLARDANGMWIGD